MEKFALIVTEKPEAARRIAEALDYGGTPQKFEDRGVPYFLALRDRKLIVVPALGHLYTVVHRRGRRNYYPVFCFKWAPRHLVERNSKKIHTWIDVISKLADGADEFIDASDYDIEGSLIGYCILKYACKDKENTAKRMRFSTLTKMELEAAYEERLPQLDFGLIEAGKTRHEIDWLYGINLSRALTLSSKGWSGKYATLSTGRVQGPTLKFLVDLEKEIQCFIPKPYWSIKVEVEVKGSIFRMEYERKTITKRTEADIIVAACNGRIGEIINVDVRKFRQQPPFPFDLGTLQAEAYRLFKYTPRQTLNIAQHLYLNALISYPRTSSQKLPPAINYKAIIKALSEDHNFKDLTLELLKKKNLKSREGKKVDPAHPAVYPTGNLPKKQLSRPEKRIFDLVVRRFMAVFGDPAIKQSMKVSMEINGHVFYLRGMHILAKGWMHFYMPYIKAEEVPLPSVEVGSKIRLIKVEREDKFTNPPLRYNPSSILQKMEEAGLGTKATRADIIEALYSRDYIKERRIIVTDLGFDVAGVLEVYCPSVVSEKLTRHLEEKMEQIQNNIETSESVTLEAVDQLKPMLEKLKENEKEVGEVLSNAINKARMQERIVGKCNDCGSGNLMILYSRKTRKRFIGCTNYFKGLCKLSFSLPQRGSVKPVRKNCNVCGWPIVQIRMKGKQPWMLCFNSRCPLKEEKT